MIWNKKKDGAENPGAETPAAQTTKAPVLLLQKNWQMARAGGLCGDRGRCDFCSSPRAPAPQPWTPAIWKPALKCGMSPTP